MTSSTAYPVSPSGRPLQFYGRAADAATGRSTGPVRCPSSQVGWVVASAFLFWPLAVVAFCYAIQVRSRYAAGDRNGALQASSEAEHWGRTGVAVGLVFVCLGALLVLMIAGGAILS